MESHNSCFLPLRPWKKRPEPCPLVARKSCWCEDEGTWQILQMLCIHQSCRSCHETNDSGLLPTSPGRMWGGIDRTWLPGPRDNAGLHSICAELPRWWAGNICEMSVHHKGLPGEGNVSGRSDHQCVQSLPIAMNRSKMLWLAQWGWLQIAVYFVMFNKYVRQYGHYVTVFRNKWFNHYAMLMILILILVNS